MPRIQFKSFATADEHRQFPHASADLVNLGETAVGLALLEAVVVEARGVAFLAPRDPGVYRRQGHWRTAMPSAEVRLLPG